jgi:hypothetical protein
MEEFRLIETFPNYSVSNLGNVRNNKTGRILAKSPHKSGYIQVQLFKDSTRTIRKIHRLVAEAFLEGFNPEMYIDHIDRDKLNNNVSNLRMVNPTESCLNRGTWGKSQYKGAYYSVKRGDWRSQIRVNKVCISLGCFKTELEAGIAYNKYIENNNLEGYLKNIFSC